MRCKITWRPMQGIASGTQWHLSETTRTLFRVSPSGSVMSPYRVRLLSADTIRSYLFPMRRVCIGDCARAISTSLIVDISFGKTRPPNMADSRAISSRVVTQSSRFAQRSLKRSSHFFRTNKQPRRAQSMKSAKQLLQAYIDGSAKDAAPLFAEDGALELPYLADLGVEPRYEGPKHIEAFLTFLHEKMYPNFKFVDVKIYIDTPDQAFGEYTIHQKSGISGRLVHQRFFGHCTTANGKIVLLREALNVLAAADGMFPNGIADVINKK